MRTYDSTEGHTGLSKSDAKGQTCGPLGAGEKKHKCGPRKQKTSFSSDNDECGKWREREHRGKRDQKVGTELKGWITEYRLLAGWAAAGGM